jgi:hypothetical protein
VDDIVFAGSSNSLVARFADDIVTPGPIWMAHEWPMSAGARV